ncbi:MAG: hypothetical protein ACM3NW_12990, partial [Syntrophomonadaceae bacterium]
MTRTAALALALILSAAFSRADIGTLETPADFAAEFARAADLLEAGKRTEAAGALDMLRLRAARPSWDA